MGRVVFDGAGEGRDLMTVITALSVVEVCFFLHPVHQDQNQFYM